MCLSKTLLIIQGKLLSLAKSTNSSTPKSVVSIINYFKQIMHITCNALLIHQLLHIIMHQTECGWKNSFKSPTIEESDIVYSNSKGNTYTKLELTQRNKYQQFYHWIFSSGILCFGNLYIPKASMMNLCSGYQLRHDHKLKKILQGITYQSHDFHILQH